MSILSPWYVFRPGMIGRRLKAVVMPSELGVVSERLPFGPMIEFDAQRTMGRALYFNGTHELSMSEVAYRLAYGASLAADVGANIGYVSLVIATALAPSGRCHAFEPVSALHARLQRNVRANSELSERIVVNATAVTAVTGRSVLSIPDDANEGLATLNRVCGAHRSIEVATVALDDYFDETSRIDLMKLDVEGHEASVLEGAGKLIEGQRVRNIIFEEHGGHDSAIIRALGKTFELFFIGGDLLGPKLVPIGNVKELPKNSACNWLATLDPDFALHRMRGRGWRVLGW